MRSSKYKTASEHFSHKPILDLSQNTSEVMRFAEGRNNNILELLEESMEEKRTDKGKKTHHNELWDFFGRFEK